MTPTLIADHCSLQLQLFSLCLLANSPFFAPLRLAFPVKRIYTCYTVHDQGLTDRRGYYDTILRTLGYTSPTDH